MSKGKVKEYDSSCGYGIIIDFDTGQQLTVYANYINFKKGEFLKEEKEVEYEIENNRHRNLLVNVKILEEDCYVYTTIQLL